MVGCRVSLLVFLYTVVMAGSWRQAQAGPTEHRLHPRQQETTASGEVSIVGGKVVERGEVPYLVSLQDVRWTPTQPRHYCGGSIYNSTTIITAAHCVNPFVKNYLGVEVVAGDHRRSVLEGSEQVMEVKEIIIHPEFDGETYMNDIAIIRLTEHLHFNEYVQSILLPPEGTSLSGECMVAGWGPMQEDGEDADVPYKAIVPIWPHDECSSTLAGVFDVGEHMVCAGYEEGGVGACESDSGSPLTCYADSVPYLGGVVSWQFGCSRPFRPAIYTNLVYFSNWLKQLSMNVTQTSGPDHS